MSREDRPQTFFKALERTAAMAGVFDIDLDQLPGCVVSCLGNLLSCSACHTIDD
uniref:Uncharacterized protein n=1 Tax=Amphilophus citrinellus TaxID=61819 RepID=A0A3Q0S1Z8_AMPCI